MGGTTAVRTNERMWQSIKNKVKQSSKGGVPGTWSARKAQIAVREYKSRGGRYKGRKSPNNSLTRWSKQKWGYINSNGSSKKRGRYLPQIVRKHLSAKSRQSENRRKGSRRGQRVPYGSEVKRLMRKHRIYSSRSTTRSSRSRSSRGGSKSKSSRKLKCWSGYERVPGTKAGTKGSCRKRRSR